MILSSRIVHRPTERTSILETQVGETRLHVALVDCDGVASPAGLQRCLEEIQAVGSVERAGLDMRILEIVDPSTARERAIRACFEVRAGTMIAFCYRGAGCLAELARALGLVGPLHAGERDP